MKSKKYQWKKKVPANPGEVAKTCEYDYANEIIQ